MVPRNVLGSPERTFWIQHSLRNFTRLTPIVQLPGVGVDHHDAGVGPQERAMERGVLSRNGQALPSVNHYDPIHLSSNHEHLHLITTVITTTIRAPATVHSPSDLVLHYVDSTPAHTKLSKLPCLLTCYSLTPVSLLVFSSPTRSSVSVISVLLLCFPHRSCPSYLWMSRQSVTRQDDLWRHPLTWSLHSSSCLINTIVFLLTSVSSSICYTYCLFFLCGLL